jgi:hypothetical protein
MGETAPLTITVKEAADRLGFPIATTERVVRNLGLLIMAGNRKRVDPNDLPEIRDQCRNEPKARAYISGATRGSGLSGTPGEATVQQAREIAAKLKKPSPVISPKGTAQLVQLQRME